MAHPADIILPDVPPPQGPGRRMIAFLKARKLDTALLLSSIVCFSLFGSNSMRMQRETGILEPVAVILAGNAERKASGTTQFKPATTGTAFFNMDAAWVGPAQTAKLQLDDGTLLELSENTLITIKKPFRGRRSNQKAKDRIQVIRGSVKAGPQQLELKPALNAFPERPVQKAFPDKSDALLQSQLYPKDGFTLYLRKSQMIELIFAWPVAVSGFLVLRKDTPDAVPVYIPVREQKSKAVTLETNNTAYIWQLISDDKKIIFGPLRFQVKVLDDEVAKGLLAHPKQDKIEIYW